MRLGKIAAYSFFRAQSALGNFLRTGPVTGLDIVLASSRTPLAVPVGSLCSAVSMDLLWACFDAVSKRE